MCQTVTTQFIQLRKIDANSWVKEREVSEEDLPSLGGPGKIELLKTSVSTCWACERTLMMKSKEDLVKMLIKFYNS